MEKETYYPALAELKEAFPGRPLLSRQEVARYLNMDPRTLSGDRTFPQKKIGGRYMVSVVALARWMA